MSLIVYKKQKYTYFNKYSFLDKKIESKILLDT